MGKKEAKKYVFRVCIFSTLGGVLSLSTGFWLSIYNGWDLSGFIMGLFMLIGAFIFGAIGLRTVPEEHRKEVIDALGHVFTVAS